MWYKHQRHPLIDGKPAQRGHQRDGVLGRPVPGRGRPVPLVRAGAGPQLAPPTGQHAPAHDAYPCLGVLVPPQPRPALPRADVRLLRGVLRLGEIPAGSVKVHQDPLAGTAVELVKAIGIRHLATPFTSITRQPGERLRAVVTRRW
jgi:hypothetical protein